MKIKKTKFYYQKDFIYMGFGTCLYTSIFSCYSKLFNDDITSYNEIIKKIGNVKSQVILNALNKDIQNRLGYNEILTTVIRYVNESVETMFKTMALSICKKIPVVLCITSDNPNLIGHAIEIIGFETDGLVYYIENGNYYETLDTMLDVMGIKDSANGLNFLKSIDFKTHTKGVGEFNLRKIANYKFEFRLVYADTNNENIFSLLHFTNRLNDMNLGFKPHIYDKAKRELIEELVNDPSIKGNK